MPLMLRNWLFWLPVQLFQFGCIAPEWQVSFVCAAGLVWNAILSAVAGDCSEEGCSLLPDVESNALDLQEGSVVPNMIVPSNTGREALSEDTMSPELIAPGSLGTREWNAAHYRDI